MQPRQHVIPTWNGWTVRRESGNMNPQDFDTRDEAMNYARNLAEREQSNVVEHLKDGSYTEHIIRVTAFTTARFPRHAIRTN